MTIEDIAAEVASTDTLADELRNFLSLIGPTPTPDAPAEWLQRAVPDEFFAWPNGLTRAQRLKVVYDRAARAGRAAPSARVLLNHPTALSALLGRAAAADPDIFHVLLIHYTLVLAPILAAESTDPSSGLATMRAGLESMRRFGAALMTEGARSNSHLQARTQARFDPTTRDFVLHTPDADAVKFPNSAGHPAVSKTAAVYAQLVIDGRERGVFVFVVPLRVSDGTVVDRVQITPAPDTYALPCDYAYVSFDHKRIPFHSWLSDGATIDPDGQFHDPEGNSIGRLRRTMGTPGPPVWRGVVAGCAATAQASALILHEQSTGRLTMGRLAPEQPLMHYRVQQEAVFGALAVAYALAVVAQHCVGIGPAARTGNPTSPAGHEEPTWAPWSAVDRDLALLKALATRVTLETIIECRSRCGARGFISTDRLTAYLGYVHAYFCAGGDNGLILMDTAHIMSDPMQYQPPDPEPTPAPDADFTAPLVCASLARAAERYYHERLMLGLSEARHAGQDTFTAWNDNLALAQTAAAAQADRLVAELLADVYDTAPPPVQLLLRLFLLATVERHAGFLADQRLVPPHLLDRIWRYRRDLCDELAPHIPDLISAIDLPREHFTTQAPN